MLTYFVKVMTPKFVERYNNNQKKSAIIITGNYGDMFQQLSSFYTMLLKQFINNLTRGLSFELEPMVDVLYYTPAFVHDDGSFRRLVFKMNPEDAASCCLRDLGIELQTSGRFTHSLYNIFTNGLYEIAFFYRRILWYSRKSG